MKGKLSVAMIYVLILLALTACVNTDSSAVVTAPLEGHLEAQSMEPIESETPSAREHRILIAYFTWAENTVVPDLSAVDVDTATSASVRDIRTALPGVTVPDAVGVQRPGMDTPLDTARSTVTNWLAELGY